MDNGSPKISDELEGIVESKRIPNALIFRFDGSNSELEMSLEFAKKILLSKETDPVNQNKIIKGDTVPFISRPTRCVSDTNFK